jgi:hypothetical protein
MEIADDDIGTIRVFVLRNRRGLFVATSPDIVGLNVTHRDVNAILADMPNIIRVWLKRTRGLDVRVFQETVEDSTESFNITALTMPAAVARHCAHV